jgi:hypothetical protein
MRSINSSGKILFMAMLGVLFFVWFPVYSVAHHPAEDIVDEEIYDMIDEMVAATPHADLFVEDDMTVITTDTVTVAEDLIDEGLLADLSLLDEPVTVTIEFLPTESSSSIFSTLGNDDKKNSQKHKKWSEWGGPVKITIVPLTSY